MPIENGSGGVDVAQANMETKTPLESAKKEVQAKYASELPSLNSVRAILEDPKTKLEDLYGQPELMRLFSINYSNPNTVDAKMMDQLRDKIRTFLVQEGFALKPEMTPHLDGKGYITIPREGFIVNDQTPQKNRVIFGQELVLGLKDGKLAPEIVGSMHYEGKKSGRNF